MYRELMYETSNTVTSSVYCAEHRNKKCIENSCTKPAIPSLRVFIAQSIGTKNVSRTHVRNQHYHHFECLLRRASEQEMYRELTYETSNTVNSSVYCAEHRSKKCIENSCTKPAIPSLRVFIAQSIGAINLSRTHVQNQQYRHFECLLRRASEQEMYREPQLTC